MLPEVATVKLMLGLGPPFFPSVIAEWLRCPLVDAFSVVEDGAAEETLR
jgi:hypothetical protein